MVVIDLGPFIPCRREITRFILTSTSCAWRVLGLINGAQLASHPLYSAVITGLSTTQQSCPMNEGGIKNGGLGAAIAAQRAVILPGRFSCESRWSASRFKQALQAVHTMQRSIILKIKENGHSRRYDNPGVRQSRQPDSELAF